MTEYTPVLAELMRVIQDRKAHPPARSYTTSLFQGGVPTIGAKLLEEAQEVIEAAEAATDDEGREHLAHEAADLIYHLLVMLGHCEVELSAVESTLAARFGVSGLDEKASRAPRTPPE